MKWVKLYSLLIFMYVFQTVLGDSIKICGILPDLMLVLTIYAVLNGKRPAVLVFALVSGLLKDFSLMQTFGLNAFITLYIAFFVSIIVEKYFYPTVLVNGIFVFSAGFLYQLCYFFFRFFIWGEKRFMYPVVNVILPQCLYNFVLSFFVFWLCSVISGEKIVFSKQIRRGSK